MNRKKDGAYNYRNGSSRSYSRPQAHYYQPREERYFIASTRNTRGQTYVKRRYN